MCGGCGHNKRTCPTAKAAAPAKSIVVAKPLVVAPAQRAWWKGSVELEVAIICFINQLPMEAQHLIGRLVFSNRLPTNFCKWEEGAPSIALQALADGASQTDRRTEQIRCRRDHDHREANHFVSQKTLGNAASPLSQDAGRHNSIMRGITRQTRGYLRADITFAAIQDFGKGNSAPKKHFQLYYEAISAIDINSALINQPPRQSPLPRPFKKLTRGSWAVNYLYI